MNTYSTKLRIAQQFLIELPHWDRLSAILYRRRARFERLLKPAQAGQKWALELFLKLAELDDCGKAIMRFVLDQPPAEEVPA